MSATYARLCTLSLLLTVVGCWFTIRLRCISVGKFSDFKPHEKGLEKALGGLESKIMNAKRLLGNSESRRAKLPLVLASIAGLVLIAVYAC